MPVCGDDAEARTWVIVPAALIGLDAVDGGDLAALNPLLPVFSSYVLSFVYVDIYWNNHHDMLHPCRRISGSPSPSCTPSPSRQTLRGPYLSNPAQSRWHAV